MEQDEGRQETIKQNALSDSYSAGSASKKRKMQLAVQNAAIGPESVFATRLQEALKASGYNNAQGEAEILANTGRLPELYRRLLTQSLASRLRSDPDFDPARFPNAAALFTNLRPSQITTTTTTSQSNNNNNDDEMDDERTIDEALNQS